MRVVSSSEHPHLRTEVLIELVEGEPANGVAAEVDAGEDYHAETQQAVGILGGQLDAIGGDSGGIECGFGGDFGNEATKDAGGEGIAGV